MGCVRSARLNSYPFRIVPGRDSPDNGGWRTRVALAKTLKIAHIPAGMVKHKLCHGFASSGDLMTTNTTLTRADLAETLNRHIGLSRSESATMVESILSKMCGALAEGENVKISGFGTFVLRDKNERVGRNPKTGEPAAINPRRVISFRASQIMKSRVHGAGA